MALPNKLYYVQKTPGSKPLHWWENRKGSGLFTKAHSALYRHADLGRDGIETKIYVGEVTWKEVEPLK